MPVVCHRPARSNLTVITRYFFRSTVRVIQTETKKEVYGWDFAVFTQPVLWRIC